MRKLIAGLLLSVLSTGCGDVTSPETGLEIRPDFSIFTTIEVIDLGTLGGAKVSPWAINELGHVTGNAETETGSFHAFFWSPETGMLDLGASGGTYSIGQDLNDLDQVAGWSRDENGAQHSFLWSLEEGVTEIWSESRYTKALGVNNLGQVVGRMAYEDNPSQVGPVLWSQEEGLTILPGPDPWFAEAQDINDLGQIVGDFISYQTGTRNLFTWSSSGDFQDLGPVGQPDPLVYGLNQAGQAVGYNMDGDAFLWEAETGLIWLSVATAGRHFQALDINDMGWVVGGWSNFETFTSQAVVWNDQGEMIELPTPSGDHSFATGINNSGQIVGRWTAEGEDESRPIIWVMSSTPPTPQEQVASLQEDVRALQEEGLLNRGETRSLISKLDAVSRQLSKENWAPARNLLQAFINQIEAMRKSGRLSDAEADLLINPAQTLIEQLSQL